MTLAGFEPASSSFVAKYSTLLRYRVRSGGYERKDTNHTCVLIAGLPDGGDGRIRTYDLKAMNLASYHCYHVAILCRCVVATWTALPK